LRGRFYDLRDKLGAGVAKRGVSRSSPWPRFGAAALEQLGALRVLLPKPVVEVVERVIGHEAPSAEAAASDEEALLFVGGAAERPT